MLTKLFDELASSLLFEGGKHFLASMLWSAPCSKNINGGPFKWLLLRVKGLEKIILDIANQGHA
jgi:hypothetical protein